MNLLPYAITDESVLLDLIPQKKPFVMVDKLLYFSQEQVVSGLSITAENLFTENAIFNAPGLIENMAQTVALHTGYEYYLKKEPAPTGYIGAIKKVEIMALPKIGQELITTVTILHSIMGITLVQAEVKCNETIIALSEMKTALA
ncbi:hypothetical protein [Kriegella aquimaris]|uniref:3-hydroxymyristoyl/3-hydroxydecanoyl-(Acyl carrier protein) dehydratase n=1 Tax=Kriegella aquimaris TaxID=192904 RepID=A0A1G9SU69_9FLAO|nr:hypothetical protein [Kriegella aquimaris]SDM39029.1 hypothetical protein SAMN04488514_108104 [Kriegella aquimaris]